MLFNDDKRIKFPVPFLKSKTVLYVDSRTGTSHEYIEFSWEYIMSRLERLGYSFAFLPDLVSQLSPDLMQYMFPGQDSSVFAEDLYQRIQDLAGLNGKTGFLYKQGRAIYFHALPEGPKERIAVAIDEFIEFLRDIRSTKRMLPEENDIIPSRKELASPVHKRIEPGIMGDMGGPRFSVRSEEEPLDPKAQAIIKAWEKIEKEFGITLKDLEILMGYTVKLSELHITTAGNIILTGFSGREVKMDDITKAIYFYFLRHPEGTPLKELQSHEDEILGYYMGITGRDNPDQLRHSLHNHLDPYGNSINVSISRIKKAFKDIVGDRIARFYYVDGKYAEPRKVALDRDFVIWEH